MPNVDDVKMASEKSFGFIFSAIFLIIGVVPLLSGGVPYILPLTISFVLLIITIISPTRLRLLNKVWFHIGILLHNVISPIMLCIIFLFGVVPTALVIKFLRKDPLQLRANDAKKTYWIFRDSESQTPEKLKKQF